ncbi:MAG: YggT family protein [Candidatus Omnitrophica bacterium]|nr:YggT family protein [Candidatus Omnitrophota bacterium]
MFIIGNFLIAVAAIIGIILQLVTLLIFIRAVISWFSPDPYNPLVRFLDQATEPILQPLRRFMPPMAVDFSPFIALLLIIFINRFFVASLSDVGYRLKYQSERRGYPELLVPPEQMRGSTDSRLIVP